MMNRQLMVKTAYACLLACFIFVLWNEMCRLYIPVNHMTRFVLQNSSDINQSSQPNPRCAPFTRVYFLKVHKAGSSTVASIIQRFGIARNLNFVVPNRTYGELGFNYIGKYGRLESVNDIMALPKGRQFDLLWNHVVYNRTAFRSLMPSDTQYIAIIREPFQQFVSEFDYHGPWRKPDNFYEMDSHQKLIEDYLKNPSDFEYNREVLSRTRNSMAYDFGFTNAMVSDKTLRFQYLDQLSKDFKLVMLLEYFDESLVLLKRYLCWDTRDILYFHLNKNKLRKPSVFAHEHHLQHEVISQSDYDIYTYFYSIFWEKIWTQGPEFFSEVLYFKQLLPMVNDHCLLNKTFHVSKTVWHNNFTVDWNDCQKMNSTEMDLYSIIYNKTLVLIQSPE